MSDLAIVIVSYNACADLEACLDALAVHPPATPHEIVVVDNASADGSAQVARARWPHITVIDAGGNLGFARATNLGIRATVSPLLLLLSCGMHGNAVRVMVPLTASDAIVEEGLAIFEEAVAAAVAEEQK